MENGLSSGMTCSIGVIFPAGVTDRGGGDELHYYHKQREILQKRV